MALPVFYSADITGQDSEHMLNEETSRHIVQVLRMQEGEQLNVTNGKGYMFLASIAGAHKKEVSVKIVDKQFIPQRSNISVAISLLKNVQRFEWFLEKAVEIGVSEIFPLVCTRTEKHHFRSSRMQGIMVSAMLQSQQSWLPFLHEPQKFQDFISRPVNGIAFIAHCIAEEGRSNIQQFHPLKNPMIVIGPEGDFTPDEVASALDKDYKPVTLGSTRLRTETAAIVAVTLLNTFNVHPQD